MRIYNTHIIKDFWLMYKKPYKIKDVVFNSPLVDKETYDAASYILRGVAIELENGKKYVATREMFDENKVEYEGKYYSKKWKTF